MEGLEIGGGGLIWYGACNGGPGVVRNVPNPAAMSAVDLGQENSLSDRYFLLLQATIKRSKVLRVQVAERTEKEADVNRLTVKL